MSFFARLFGIAPTPAPSPKTPFDAGVAALERGRCEEALAHFAVALTVAATPREAGLVHNKTALTHLRRADREAAICALCAALTADPRCFPALVNTGNLLLEDGAIDDAITHYEAALRVDESYAPAHLNLGIAYKRLGKRAAAVRAFRRANRLEAGLPRPR